MAISSVRFCGKVEWHLAEKNEKRVKDCQIVCIANTEDGLELSGKGRT